MMNLRRTMKSEPSQNVAAQGILHHDWEAVTACQRECTARFGMTIQIEQEAYLSQHPEIGAMLRMFIANMTNSKKYRSNLLKETSEYFLRDPEIIDQEIKQNLELQPEDTSYFLKDKDRFYYKDINLTQDLRAIVRKHYPPPPFRVPTAEIPTPDTLSSSFLSKKTSDTTLPTPEAPPPREITLEEIFYEMISNTVDKAVYQRVDEGMLRYDTAYVELSKAVEAAMEVPVIEIREDIAMLIYTAYTVFEQNIMNKEQLATEMAWEKRMRKKMKRSLRRANNFKGYETPPTPKSELSSHESYRRPPPRPCKCHPQWHYNRYGKDRFGIYLPSQMEYSNENITVTPAISSENSEHSVDAKSTKTVDEQS